MFFFSSKKQKGFTRPNFLKSKNSDGFTLIEMLVVIVIVGIFTALILGSGFSDSNNRAKDDSAINEVLLSLKEVQSWGTGSRQWPEGSGTYDAGFGIYLKKGVDRYVLFGEDVKFDKDGLVVTDNKYGGKIEVDEKKDKDDEKELVEKKELQSSFIVDDICVANPDEKEVCGFNEVNFVYRRHNLGPIIKVNGSGSIESVEVHFKNGREVKKTLVVSSFGKLYIE